jgi:hypothetical protein
MKSRWRAREANSDVGISGVVAARPMSPSLDAMQAWLATLEQGLAGGTHGIARQNEIAPQSGPLQRYCALNELWKALEFATAFETMSWPWPSR